MQYKHISTPIFKFGMPAVKWIEINDSIVEPYIKTNDIGKTLIFIDTEWGPQNTPVEITSKRQFTETFGSIPDVLESQKGYDYLSQYLQYMLQGSIPMYVVRVAYPHLKDEQHPEQGYNSIEYYKQVSQYEFYPTIFFKHNVDMTKPITVQNDQQTVTYILNTDYNLALNGITLLKFSNFVTGANLKITYTRLDTNTETTQNYTTPNQYEQFSINAKQPGLFGQDFGIKLYFDNIYATWNQEIGIVEEQVSQSRQMNGSFKSYESFVQDSLGQLVNSINTDSKYIELIYIYQNPSTMTISPTQTMSSDPIVIKTTDDATTFTIEKDYYVTLQDNKIHLIFSEDGLDITTTVLKVTYIPDGETDPVTEELDVPVMSYVTQQNEANTQIFRLGEEANQVQEIYSQCPICQGQDDIQSRYNFYNNYKYYDQVQQTVIFNPLECNSFYNQPKSMNPDFSKIIDDLISEFEIDNPESYNISYIATMGLNKHSYFND